MIRKALSVIVIVLIGATAAHGRTFYVTKTGNDAANGTSWGTAWRTTAKVNSNVLAGDTVRFGTGRWYNSQIVAPPNGSAALRTVYACSTFSSATWNRTSICGGDSVRNWVLHSGSVYKARWQGSGCWYSTPYAPDGSQTLCQNDTMFLPVSSLGNVNAPGRFYHNTGTDTIYAWLFNNANPNTREMLASCKPPAYLTHPTTKNVLFYGIDFRMGKQGTVLFDGSADSVSFVHCNLSRASHEWGENPAVVMSRNFIGSGWGEFNSFVACSIGVSRSMDNTGDDYHAGTGAIIYTQRQMRFDSCTFYDLPTGGIFFKLDHGDIGHSYNNKVRFSRFVGPARVGIYVGRFHDGDSLYGNTLTNISEYAIRLGFNEPNYGNHYVGNNTLYDCNVFIEMADPTPYAMSKIRYNICQDIHNMTVLDMSYWVGFRPDGSPYNHSWYTIDSNQYYDASQAFDFMFQHGSRQNWAFWTGTLGFDVRGRQTNPGFTNPPAGDFSRLSSTQEMNVTYGGRTWTRWGAWQPGGGQAGDSTPPDTVDWIGFEPGLHEGEINLIWRAPGDDGIAGMASRYELRVSPQSFASSAWEQIPLYGNVPSPLPAGSAQSMTITGMDPGRVYYLAMKAFDEAGNGSPTSQIIQVAAGEKASTGGEPVVIVPDSPAEGALLRTSRPTLFALNPETPSAPLVFRFEIASDFDFVQIVAESGPVPQMPGPTTSWEVLERLPAGQTLYWRVSANNGAPSQARLFTIETIPHPYPNPFDMTATSDIRFTELPSDASLYLMTIAGDPVRYWADLTGDDIVWDGTNQRGHQVSSGTYLWYLEGTPHHGKVVVIR